MKRFFYLLIMLLCIATGSWGQNCMDGDMGTDNSDSGSSVSKEDYQLVFSSETAERAGQYLMLTDEEKTNCKGCFLNYSALEASWDYCPKLTSTWNRHMGATLDEQRQNVDFDNETLRLYATYSDSDWLTSGVQTKSGFQYGIIEIKARCKAQAGNFPALWFMPLNAGRGWPACGEIDLMEMVNNSYTVYGTVHNAICRCNSGYRNDFHGEAAADGDFHIYTLKWTADALDWYLDGTLFYTYKKDTSLQGEELDNQWPFDKSFYLIVNQSVGDGGWASEPADTSAVFEMDVAYVRVYQKTVASIRNVASDATDMDNAPLYNLSGQRVNTDKGNVLIRNGYKYVN